jgi:hypothetical protein
MILMYLLSHTLAYTVRENKQQQHNEWAGTYKDRVIVYLLNTINIKAISVNDIDAQKSAK